MSTNPENASSDRASTAPVGVVPDSSSRAQEPTLASGAKIGRSPGVGRFTWPDLSFPPINLYSMPRQNLRR